MTGIAHSSHINQVGTVFVPVSDQERALDFYLHKLGFEKRGDLSYGEGGRWIEVAPPGSTIAIALIASVEGKQVAPGSTHCAFSTDDIEAAHAALRARGVEADAEIGRTGTSRPGLVSREVTIEDPMPPQFSLRDPDGNRFLIVQSPRESHGR